MIIFIKLLLAHLLGDFLLQPRSWVAEKEKFKIKSQKLFLHILIHGALVWLLLWNLQYWPVAAIIMICHFGIDLLKLYLQKERSRTSWFVTDQLLHLLSLIIVFFIFFQPEWQLTAFIENPRFWLFVTALLLITFASGIIIQVLMQKWTEELGENNSQSLKSAGKYIGILERLFIFTFILIGH